MYWGLLSETHQLLRCRLLVHTGFPDPKTTLGVGEASLIQPKHSVHVLCIGSWCTEWSWGGQDPAFMVLASSSGRDDGLERTEIIPVVAPAWWNSTGRSDTKWLGWEFTLDGASEEVAFARLLGQEGNSCESLGRTCPGRGNRMYGKGKSLSCYPHFTDEDTKAQRGGVVRSRLGLRFSVSNLGILWDRRLPCWWCGLWFYGPDAATEGLSLMGVTGFSSEGIGEGRRHVVRTGILS